MGQCSTNYSYASRCCFIGVYQFGLVNGERVTLRERKRAPASKSLNRERNNGAFKHPF